MFEQENTEINAMLAETRAQQIDLMFSHFIAILDSVCLS